jgi:hypothetical protein
MGHGDRLPRLWPPTLRVSRADAGESDPEDAVEDVLETFAADRILVFIHTGDEQRYREDVDADALQSRFGIPVTQARI